MEKRSGRRDQQVWTGSPRAQEEKSTQLDESEYQEAVKERTAISAHVVYEAISAEGESELQRPTSALMFSGLAAGLSMGFSFLSQGLLAASIGHNGYASLVSKFGYCVGFLIVILGRQQLFTENTLTPIIPLLKYKKTSVFWNTLRLWVAVFAANWAGTVVIALVLAHTSVIPSDARSVFDQLAREVLQGGFSTVFVKAVFAGWLIALLVWVLPFAETGRVPVIVIMTYVISLGGFSHVVAGSVDTFYLLALGESSCREYFVGFLVPTLLGNIAGGVSLVAALNHAQVKAGQY